MNFKTEKHILIVNQHGENRGDEAAMRAMIRGLSKRLARVSFTAIVQFQDINLDLHFQERVSLIQMKMPYLHFLNLLIFTILKSFHLETILPLTSNVKHIIDAYNRSDIVISAPGGPYFGDLYYKHELLHWLFIFLAVLHAKPIFLYAPSCGPFRHKLMNLIRKSLYKKFSILCVRETISKKYLENLLGKDPRIYLTADSALQEKVTAYDRHKYFKGKKDRFQGRFLVSVSAINHLFLKEKSTTVLQKNYEKVLIKCLLHIQSQKDAYFMFFPQLYGRIHSDIDYLKYLGNKLPKNYNWEIIDPLYDSDMQRQLISMTDFCIASRYHPQIFAASSNIPGISIYYQHKIKGFMESLGMEAFCFNILHLDLLSICNKIDIILDNYAIYQNKIQKNISILMKNANKTSDLVLKLLKT